MLEDDLRAQLDVPGSLAEWSCNKSSAVCKEGIEGRVVGVVDRRIGVVD